MFGPGNHPARVELQQGDVVLPEQEPERGAPLRAVEAGHLGGGHAGPHPQGGEGGRPRPQASVMTPHSSPGTHSPFVGFVKGALDRKKFSR